MMLTLISNPEEVALRLLGEDAPENTPYHRKVVLLRQSLQNGDTWACSAVSLNYAATVSAMAAIELTTLFRGKVTPIFTGETPEFEGFYRAGYEGDLFHLDSIDYEDALAERRETGEALMTQMVEAGINFSQSMNVLTLDTPVTVYLSGTIIDFTALYRSFGRKSTFNHPQNNALAIEIWSDISVRFKAFSEAVREAPTV